VRKAIAIIAFLVVSFPCAAEDINTGAPVKLLTDLPLRTEPPGGLFGLKGERIGSAQKGQYTVVDTKSIMTVSGGQHWLKVQDRNDPSKVGWIYFGPIGSTVGNAVLDKP
jgi:hypothetical protein